MAKLESEAITAFIDAVWLEDGLSANTLAAYRQDLTGFDEWLRLEKKIDLDQAAGADIEAWFAAKHAVTKASTCGLFGSIVLPLIPVCSL